MAEASSSSFSVAAFDSSKAVEAQQKVDPSLYADWTTAPLGMVMKNRLNGKVALVTGASAGIGAITARRLAAEGAKVVLLARREDKLAAIVNAIKKNGDEASYLVGDATSEEDNKKLVEFALKQYGGLHITFNNAGIVRGYGQKPWEISLNTFNEQMSSNVNSIFFAIKYQAPAISQSGGGVILNNGSLAAIRRGIPTHSIYPASKNWVIGYSQHVATDLAKIGVRINTISPGNTFSDILGAENMKMIERSGKFNAIGRAVKPEEIAASVAFLACDEAIAITGTDLLVDGGFQIADKTSGIKYLKDTGYDGDGSSNTK